MGAKDLPGKPLTSDDHKCLARSWISPELAEQAMLRRVTPEEAAQWIGPHRGKKLAGILIPNILPGTNEVRQFRLRRDYPDMESQDGSQREVNQYLSSKGAQRTCSISRERRILLSSRMPKSP